MHRSGWTFYTNLKSNRKVSLRKEIGYQDLSEIEWTPEQLISGQLVRIKEVPFWLKLFKLVDTNGDIEWVITNKSAEDFYSFESDSSHSSKMASRANFTEVSSN